MCLKHRSTALNVLTPVAYATVPPFAIGYGGTGETFHLQKPLAQGPKLITRQGALCASHPLHLMHPSALYERKSTKCPNDLTHALVFDVLVLLFGA